MVISLVMQKGGSSKSTLALNLAGWLAAKGKDVLIVDADPQQSISHFGEKRNINASEICENIADAKETVEELESQFAKTKSDAIYKKLLVAKKMVLFYEEHFSLKSKQLNHVSIITKLGASLDNEVKALRKKYDHVIIDTGGREAVEARKALMISDLIIIPVIPSEFDVKALDGTLNSFSYAKSYNENLLGVLIPSKVTPNPMVQDGESLIDYLDAVQEELDGIALYRGKIHERSIYKKSVTMGLSVFEMPDSDAKKKAVEELDRFFGEIFNTLDALNKN